MKQLTVRLTDEEYDALVKYNSDTNERLKEEYGPNINIALSTTAGTGIQCMLEKLGYLKK